MSKIIGGTMIAAGAVGGGLISNHFTSNDVDRAERKSEILAECHTGTRPILRLADGLLDCSGVRVYETESNNIALNSNIQIDWDSTIKQVEENIQSKKNSKIPNESVAVMAGVAILGAGAYLLRPVSNNRKESHGIQLHLGQYDQ